MGFFEDRKIKRALKAIQRQQQRDGINPGDVCPRCGDTTMGRNSVYLKDDGVSVCAECNMEMSLAGFTGKENYEKWAAISGIQDDEWKPNKKKRREIISKFVEGDHIIDAISDFPGVVREVLPQGLYAVQPDGETIDNTVTLKDREILFDVDELPHLSDRFRENTNVTVFRAFGVADSRTEPKDAVIVGTDNTGHVKIKLQNGEEAELCLDTDLFQMYQEVEPVVVERDSLLDMGSEFDISF